MELLQWYDGVKRDLPWRTSTEMYPVWVSEIMLQQTRVATAITYFENWMARFPTVQVLAGASEDEVMAAWSGLGYYSRARNLHAAAKQVTEHGWPRELQELPGVGPYTAAAIGSICRGEPVAVVDGNVERVVSRLAAIEDNVRGVGRRLVRDAANQFLDHSRPGDWNQAMMELGALVCKPAPVCPECPVRNHCKANAAGIQDGLPLKPSKKPPAVQGKRFAFVDTPQGILMRKRGEGELLAGTWCLPDFDEVEAQTGFKVKQTGDSWHRTHQFTHRTWHMETIPCVLDDGLHHHRPDVRFIPDLREVGVSTAMRKALNL